MIRLQPKISRFEPEMKGRWRILEASKEGVL
jgi:hypothetical protein